MNSTIYILSDGTVEAVGDVPIVNQLGQWNRKRMSNILPVNPVKRVAFLLLRLAFGERGRVAEWTRQWAGPWRCRLFATGETVTHQSRRVVLAWEHGRLEQLIADGKIQV